LLYGCVTASGFIFLSWRPIDVSKILSNKHVKKKHRYAVVQEAVSIKVTYCTVPDVNE